MAGMSNIEVFGLERAIKTAKYPKAVDVNKLNDTLTPGIHACLSCDTGTGHDTALDGIVVLFDLTLSQNAWQEAQRYHFLDFVSSMSKMHKLQAMELKEHCNRYVDPRVINIENEKIAEYNRLLKLQKESPDPARKPLIDQARLEMLYNVPCGFELTAGMVTNYRQLKTILQQRRTHFLPDWQIVCDQIEQLPRFMELTQKGGIVNA